LLFNDSGNIYYCSNVYGKNSDAKQLGYSDTKLLCFNEDLVKQYENGIGNISSQAIIDVINNKILFFARTFYGKLQVIFP
jgi:hypothetical protein